MIYKVENDRSEFQERQKHRGWICVLSIATVKHNEDWLKHKNIAKKNQKSMPRLCLLQIHKQMTLTETKDIQVKIAENV